MTEALGGDLDLASSVVAALHAECQYMCQLYEMLRDTKDGLRSRVQSLAGRADVVRQADSWRASRKGQEDRHEGARHESPTAPAPPAASAAASAAASPAAPPPLQLPPAATAAATTAATTAAIPRATIRATPRATPRPNTAAVPASGGGLRVGGGLRNTSGAKPRVPERTALDLSDLPMDDVTGARLHTDPVTSFGSARLGLGAAVLKGIYGMGFEDPSPAQRLALEPMLRGHDVICQAHSGMGKTAAFAIPVLDRIDVGMRGRGGHVQAVVLANAKELAEQTAETLRKLGRFLPGGQLVVHTCVGGTSVAEDREMLRHGVHVVVGTPGRVLSLLEHGDMNPAAVELAVLDEADRLLDESFVEEVRRIFVRLPRRTQLGIFSATFPVDALETAARVTERRRRDDDDGDDGDDGAGDAKGTVLVRVEGANQALAGIKQFHVDVPANGGGAWEAKLEVLADLQDELGIREEGGRCMVFCNGKSTVEFVTEQLRAHDYCATRSLRDFRAGKRDCNVLVTTDALARGIDVHQVQYVVNFDLPFDRECYVHRIGRCGRFGRRGCAISLVCPGTSDATKLRMIENAYGQPIQPCPSPSAIRAFLGCGGGGDGGGPGGTTHDRPSMPKAKGTAGAATSGSAEGPEPKGGETAGDEAAGKKRVAYLEEVLELMAQRVDRLEAENEQLKLQLAAAGDTGAALKRQTSG